MRAPINPENIERRTNDPHEPCKLLTRALLTRSLPHARPSRACRIAPIPFASSQAAQDSFGEEREKAVAALENPAVILPRQRDAADSRKPTVLVVQSDPYISAVLWTWLSRCGFRVVCETSGPASRQLARSLSPDAVVLDVNLSEINGLEICRQLKAEPETCSTPVIFCGEQGYLADEALELGAAAFLTVSREIFELPGCLREVLAVRV